AQAPALRRIGAAAGAELLARRRTPTALRAGRTLPHGHAVHAAQSPCVLGLGRDVRRRDRRDLRRHDGAEMARKLIAAALVVLAASSRVSASGHGPVFGGATPTLGKGGWQFDQAYMGRSTEDVVEQTLRSMI